MSKAYDQAEWPFMFGMMRKLGFLKRRINVVSDCVTTSTLSFIVNGEPCGKVLPSQGLRQGCPLSPYPFLLCVRVFLGFCEM